MWSLRALALLLPLTVAASCATEQAPVSHQELQVQLESDGFPQPDEQGLVRLSAEDWASRLTEEQYRITRKAGTERAFTGIYWDEKRDGIFHCAGCGLALYDSKTKYDSGSGWPSFFDQVKKENLKFVEDKSYGMVRIELRCARCDGHLGHIFPDGPKPTGMRHCINSASLAFAPRGDNAEKAEEKTEAKKEE